MTDSARPSLEALLALRQRRLALSDEADRAYVAWERCPSQTQRPGLRAAYLSADAAYQRCVRDERALCAALGAPDHFSSGGPSWAMESGDSETPFDLFVAGEN